MPPRSVPQNKSVQLIPGVESDAFNGMSVPLTAPCVDFSCRGESAEEAQLRHGGGKASGSVDLAFDANANGLSEGSEAVTVGVDASVSEVQTALRALGGLLQEIEVSVDAGAQRARNGGEPLRWWSR